MSLKMPKPDEKKFEKCPSGTYAAVCIGVFDLGMEKEVWEGKESVKQKVLIAFEVDERIKSGDYTGERFVLSKKYTFSSHEKATLRKHLESWRGKAFSDEEIAGFDIEKIVGKSCYIQVMEKTSQTGKQYQIISSILPLPKNVKELEIETDWTGGKYPDWIKRKQIEGGVKDVQVSEEITDASDDEVITADDDDDYYPEPGYDEDAEHHKDIPKGEIPF